MLLKNSKRTYGGRGAEFIVYLYKYHSTDIILSPTKLLLDKAAEKEKEVAEGRANKKSRVNATRRKDPHLRSVAKKVFDDKTSVPIDFTKLTAQVVGRYFLSLKKADGVGLLSKSTYASHRSAINHLWRIHKKTPPPDYVSSLAVTMKGLFNTLALSKQRGATKLTSGKIPLPFEVYSKLSKWFLEQKKASEGVFAACFLVLSWNLACRAGM